MKNTILKISTVLILTVFLGACSGGGGGSSSETPTSPITPTTKTISGTIVDGLIKDAKVCLDLDSNDACDSGEPTTTTSSTGAYTLSIDSSLNSELNIISIGGTDIATGKPFEGTLRKTINTASDSANIVVTPLTTLAQKIYKLEKLLDPTYTITKAQEKLATNLGITPAQVKANPLQDKELFAVTQKIVQATQLLTTTLQKDDSDRVVNQEVFEKVLTQVAKTVNEDSTTKDLNVTTLAGNIRTADAAVTIPNEVITAVQNYIDEVEKKIKETTTTSQLDDIQDAIDTFTAEIIAKIKTSTDIATDLQTTIDTLKGTTATSIIAVAQSSKAVMTRAVTLQSGDTTNTFITTQCGTLGGIAVYSGIDENNDGTLSISEQNPTPQVVCNGNDAPAVNFSANPLSIGNTNCPAGGIELIAGDQTTYLCNESTTQTPTTTDFTKTSTIIGTLNLVTVNAAPARKAIARLAVAIEQDEVYLIPSSINIATTEEVEAKATDATTPIPEPVIEPITVAVAADNTYEIPYLPSGEYSLVYIDDVTNEGIKIDDIYVAPDTIVTQNIESSDITVNGSVKLLAKSLQLGTDIGTATVRLNELDRNTTTDTNGSASFTGLPEGTYSVTVSKDGYVSKYVTFNIASGLETDLQTIELNSKKGKLVGKVTADVVDDLANIIVYAKSSDNSIYTTLTDSNGNYVFNALPAADGYSVIAQAHDFESSKVDNISIVNTKTSNANTITLSKAAITVGSVAGFARFGDVNASLDHAGIIVSIEGTDYEAITARDGSFILNNILAGEYTLNFTDSNHLTQTAQKSIVAGSVTNIDRVNLVPKVGNITGKIVDENSNGVEGIHITVITPSQTLTTLTDSNGVYIINGVIAGTHELIAAKPGYGVGTTLATVTENTTTDITSTPTTVTRKLLTGTINLQNTTDNAGATVTLIGSDIPAATTDTSGNFTLYGVGAGNYQLQVTKTGFITQSISLAVTSDNGYSVPYTVEMVESLGTLSGVVSLGKTDNSGVVVSIANTTYTTTTNSIGAYSMSIPVGTYTDSIQFTHPSYTTATYANDFNITASQTTSIAKVDMASLTGGVTIQVTDGANPVANANVRVIDGTTFTTDANGNVTLTNINVGNQTVTASKDGYGIGTQSVTITSNTTLDATANPIVLTQLTLTGTINLQNTTDNAGATVTLIGSDVPVATTDSSGNFTLYGVGAGNYQLQVTKTGFITQSISLAVTSDNGYSVPYTVEMEMKSGVIKGSVKLENQIDYSGVVVTLDGTEYSTITDSSGLWNLSVPVGNYSSGVSFVKKDYAQGIDDSTITVTEIGSYILSEKVLLQSNASIVGTIRVDDTADLSIAEVNIVGISGAASGVEGMTNPELNGDISFSSLPLGTYLLTVSYPDGLHEVVTKSVTLDSTSILKSIGEIVLRTSFVTINSNETYTNLLTATLSIGSSNATYMQVTEGSTTYPIEVFSKTTDIVLSSNNGLKSVTIDFFDVNSLPLSSVSDTIILDNILNNNGFVISGANTSGDTLHISLDIGETNASVISSVPGLYTNLKLFDNGLNGDETADDGVYERNYVVHTASELEIRAEARVTDKAGNTGNYISLNSLKLKTAPSIENVNVSTDALNNSMSISFTTNEPTTSLIRYGASFSTLESSENIKETLSTNHSITLSNLIANEEVYYEITVSDSSNLQSKYSAYDKLAPAEPQNLAVVAGNSEIGILWDGIVSSEVAYNLYRSDDGITFTKVNTQAFKQNYYLDETVANDQEYTYYATAVDLQGNESLSSQILSATPLSVYTGPTPLTYNLIDTNSIWLKSRSPYQVSSNTKVKAGVELILMPGTKVDFTNDSILLLEGQLKGYGTAENLLELNNGSIVFDTTHESLLNYATLNYMKIYKNIEAENSRPYYLTEMTLNDSTVNVSNSLSYSSYSNFYIKEINRCMFNESGIGSQYNGHQPKIGSANNSTFNTTTVYSNYYMAYINSASNSHFSNASFYVANAVESAFTNIDKLSGNSLSSSELNNVSVENIGTIEKSSFTDVQISNSYSTSIKDSNLTNTNVVISGDYSKLTMHYSVLDTNSTISSRYLDASHNYWSTTDLAEITLRTSYSPSQINGTHLYPIITSSDLYSADFDGDTIPDFMDYDNDNDGYSDLQEDWASDPEYGSIYNPLDATSFPVDSLGNVLEKDNDMDGSPDSEDLDDDNDGIADIDEVNYGTSPYLSDSDGDGVSDSDEVAYKYDPVNNANYPLMGNKSGINIDSSNVNSDGVVYLAGGSITLTNVTISAGTKLTIEKDTVVYLNDSTITATKTNPIVFRSSGAGSGLLYLSNTKMSYANVKLALRLTLVTNSKLSYSDVEFNNSYNTLTDSTSSITSSFINGTGGSWHNNGSILNSYVTGNYFYNQSTGIIDSSYVKLTYDYIYNEGGTVINSYAFRVYAQSNSKVENSVIENLLGSSDHAEIINSDIKMSTSNANFFFNGSFIQDYSGNFYSGLGTPEDQIGDGVVETVFTIDTTDTVMTGATYTVDGITNPRSVKNFDETITAYASSSLWSPLNVGCWWDKNNPDAFPDKNPLVNVAVLKGNVSLPDTSDNSGVTVSIPSTSLTAVTDTNGDWSITLSARTYDAIEYSKEHYILESKNIYALLETGTTTDLGALVLKQSSAEVHGTISVDEASDITLATITASRNGVETIVSPSVDGSFVFPSLPLGDYLFRVNYPNGSWESVSKELLLYSGTTVYSLANTHLRNSFVYINNNDLYTNSLDVNLSLTNANASTMQITNDTIVMAEEAFVGLKQITLSSGDGVKNISVSFKDTLGNPLIAAQSSITLDTTVNLVGLTHSGAATKGDTLHITLDANETDGFASVDIIGLVTGVTLYDNGQNGDSVANDGNYEVDYLVESADEFNIDIIASFTDRAGNIASVNSTTPLVLSTMPTISNIHEVSSSNGVTISFETNEGTTSYINYGVNQIDLNNTVIISNVNETIHSIFIALNPGEVLNYAVVVNDSYVDSVLDSQTVQISTPSVSGVNASAGDSEVGLVWSGVDGATAYNIYRSQDSNNFTKVNMTTITDLYYLDATAINGITYYYRVTSVDADGVESDKSSSLVATPSIDLAGPTEIDGAVILANTIWLPSRSPYKLTNNVLVKEEKKLILLAGTTVEMLGTDRHIMNKGYIYGYGSVDSRVTIDGGSIIFDTTNESALNFAQLNYVKIYKNLETTDDRAASPAPMSINNSVIESYAQFNFYIKSIDNTVLNGLYGGYFNSTSLYSYRYQGFPRIKTITNSVLNKVNSSGEPDTTTNAIVYADNISNSSLNGAKFLVGGSLSKSVVSSAYVVAADNIDDNNFTNSYISNWNSTTLNDNTLVNTQTDISGDYSRLTMRYNVLDSDSKITNAKYLDISHNYWGSADLIAIALQTNYSPSKDDNTHLYPIITSPLLYEADFDNDGIADYRDHDNDNDGYSDLQEDWDSDPLYGSIYSPLDDTSYPGSDTGTLIDIDTDMDGSPDSEDLDDDNDGISDIDEVNYGTSSYLSDSDGDGVSDSDEVAYKYDPVNNANYPLMGNKSGINIDSSNVNSDGVVYLAGGSITLTNVTISAGTKLTIEKDTYVYLYDSTIVATKTNPIVFRSSGVGSGMLYLSNTKMSYANIKLALRLNLSNNSKLSYSDIEFSNNGNQLIDTTSSIISAFINSTNDYYNYGTILNSYVTGSRIIHNSTGIISSSYIELSDTLYNNGGIVVYSYSSSIYSRNNSKVENSVIEALSAYSSDNAEIINSDVKISSSHNFFFNGSFIQNSIGSFYDGLGTPEDQIGDGVAETVFTIDTTTYTVDGIVNPRSAKNFTDWTNDVTIKQYFWDPANVGCLWDMNSPDVFPLAQ
ncbi:hypothetical protein GJV85_01560 [Sulfurimonas aquatica]|uniref:Fibronectin type-III domain-containing protein n=1 Tax=Sulfurimonas aquatica TaxID=2672570 RepID=A0A975AYE2_9BACT|nr:carboxypeptidase regulatory-like domain-containing protein [Sulfurimonas aquatica]QSZ40856.1 hypothetical protein GJV85_01560 [Sulfurimonas aquatica]